MDGTCEFYLSGNSCLLTPNSCLFSVGIDRSGHIDNALDGAQAADHIIQLMDARDVNHGVDNTVAVIEVACGNLMHIDLTRGKRQRNVAQHADTIARGNLQTGGELIDMTGIGRHILIPPGTDPAVGFFLDMDIHAVAAMDGNTVAAGDKADDLIAWNRRTAARKLDQTVINAFDNNTVAGFILAALLLLVLRMRGTLGLLALAAQLAEWKNRSAQLEAQTRQAAEAAQSRLDEAQAQAREQLAQARINGFAIDDGEIEPGLICVGAPIFGLDQTVVAAVSIAGPTFRMKEELDVMTRAVKATAANISRLMGGRP